MNTGMSIEAALGLWSDGMSNGRREESWLDGNGGPRNAVLEVLTRKGRVDGIMREKGRDEGKGGREAWVEEGRRRLNLGYMRRFWVGSPRRVIRSVPRAAREGTLQ